jgi:hypothetical protein
MIFNDTYRNIRPTESFRAIKTQKCKHLSNFPAVTLRELCQYYIKLKLWVQAYMQINLPQSWNVYALKEGGHFRKVQTLKNCPEFESN